MDNLREELTQVIRQCKGIVLDQPKTNQILNGNYKEVIDEFKRTHVNLDEIAMPSPLSDEAKAIADEMFLEDEDQEPHDLRDK